MSKRDPLRSSVYADQAEFEAKLRELECECPVAPRFYVIETTQRTRCTSDLLKTQAQETASKLWFRYAAKGREFALCPVESWEE